MQYVLLNRDNVVEAVSPRPFEKETGHALEVKEDLSAGDLLGRQVVVKNPEKMKLAVICNWNTPCGISTYSKYLVDALRPKVGELRIFSEEGVDTLNDHEDNVVRCWRRGDNMRSTIKKIMDWGATFVLIQHEFGIFPNASHFLRMLHDMAKIPYAVMLHSVYTHRDKTVSTSAIKNIMVHSNQAKETLRFMGHDSNIYVVPHGCVVLDDVEPLWNTFQTPYAIVQFGFGFRYKGVDRAIEAVAHLKKTDPKFKDIFYCYLCSQTSNGKNTHSDYVDFLCDKIESLDVRDNVAIIEKFHTEQVINNWLRTAKLALFPYIVDPDNTVFGASGAVRIAMANGIPVVASESHLFDDLDGVIPRPKGYLELAGEIDRIFSDENYRNMLVERNKSYIKANDWSATADRYLAAFDTILSSGDYLVVD
jgi:glycosyltransferase involved in cell wall biosynthesis